MIKGVYKIYVDGELAQEVPNVVTTKGKEIILRFLAGEVPAWANGMAVGTGDTAPSVNDTQLEFKIGGGETENTVSDIANSKVIARLTLPHVITGKIHEIALWSQDIDFGQAGPGAILFHFDRTQEGTAGAGGTDDLDNFRVGEQSIKLSPTAGATATLAYDNFYTDFSLYQDNDEVKIAYFIHDANITDVEFRLRKDASNYRSFNFAPETVPGYYVRSFTKNDFTTTGSMGWEEIEGADFIVTAGASAGEITLDGVRIDDTDPYDIVKLVSRAILDTPITKDSSQDIDIEYSIQFSF